MKLPTCQMLVNPLLNPLCMYPYLLLLQAGLHVRQIGAEPEYLGVLVAILLGLVRLVDVLLQLLHVLLQPARLLQDKLVLQCHTDIIQYNISLTLMKAHRQSHSRQ